MNTSEEKLSQYINKLTTRYSSSKEEIIRKMAANFDSDKVNHGHVTAKLGSYVIDDVDTELAPLLERINGFEDEPITNMSCQYNRFGWANIPFLIKVSKNGLYSPKSIY